MMDKYTGLMIFIIIINIMTTTLDGYCYIILHRVHTLPYIIPVYNSNVLKGINDTQNILYTN